MPRHDHVIHRILVVLPLATFLMTAGCGSKDNPGDAIAPAGACTTHAGATVTYTTDIAPIMTQNCTSCHGASLARAGIQLHTCATAANNASAAIDAIDGGSMPPGGSVPQADRDKLAAWIAAGQPL